MATSQLPAKEAPEIIVKDLMKRNAPQVARLLPRSVPTERFLAIWIQTFTDNEDLQRCTLSSFVRCVLQAAQLGGLTPGPRRQCYPVPFNNTERRCMEVQLVVGYQGLMQLSRNSGEIERFEARQVYEGDLFKNQRGIAPKLVHEQRSPWWDADPLEAEAHITHFYALAEFKSGKVQFEVMSKTRVEKHRDRYSKKSRDGKFGKAWRENFTEMGCKTVAIELCNWLPSSDELKTAVTITKQAEADVPQTLDAFDIVGVEEVAAPPAPAANGSGGAKTEKKPDGPAAMILGNFGPRANCRIDEPTVNVDDLRWYVAVIRKNISKPGREKFVDSDKKEIELLEAEIKRREQGRESSAPSGASHTAPSGTDAAPAPAAGAATPQESSAPPSTETPWAIEKEDKDGELVYPDGMDKETFDSWYLKTMTEAREIYYRVKTEMNLPADKPIPAGRRNAFVRNVAHYSQGSQGAKSE